MQPWTSTCLPHWGRTLSRLACSDIAAMESSGWAIFDAGSKFASFTYRGQPSVHVDVTVFVKSLLASGASIAGLGLHVLEETDIELNGPFVAFNSREFPPAARLTLTSTATTPEPATVLLGLTASGLSATASVYRMARPPGSTCGSERNRPQLRFPSQSG